MVSPITIDLTRQAADEAEQSRQELDDVIELLAELEERDSPPVNEGDDRAWYEQLGDWLFKQAVPDVRQFVPNVKMLLGKWDNLTKDITALSKMSGEKLGLPPFGPTGMLRNPISPAFEQARKQDPNISFMQALRKAYNETDQPWGAKFVSEAIHDPTNLIPFGLLSKGGKAVFKPSALKTVQGVAGGAMVPTGAAQRPADILLKMEGLDVAAGKTATSTFLTNLSQMEVPIPFRTPFTLENTFKSLPFLRVAAGGQHMKRIVGYMDNERLGRLYARNMYLFRLDRFRKAFPDAEGRKVIRYDQVQGVKSRVKDSLDGNWGVKIGTGETYIDNFDAMRDFSIMFEMRTNKAVRGVVGQTTDELTIYYKNLTQDQIEFVDYIHDINEQMNTVLTAGGLDPKKMFGAGFMQGYFARRIDKAWQIPEEDFAAKRIAKIGKTRDFEFDRKYRTLMDGWAAGLDYINDPMSNLHAYLTDAYLAIADKQMIDYAKSLAIDTKPALDLSKLTKTLNAVVNDFVVGGTPIAPLYAGILQANYPSLYTKLISGVPDQVSQAAVEMRQIRQQALDEVVLYKKLSVNLPEIGQLDELSLPKDFTDEFRGVLLPKEGMLGAFARPFGEISQWMKFIAAGVDFGMVFLHGFPTLGRNPVVWAKAAVNSVRVIQDTRIRTAWLGANAAEMSRYAKDYGVSFKASEVTEVFEQRGIVGHVLRSGIGKHTLGRFQEAFDFYLDYIKLNMARSLEPGALKAFARGEKKALRDMGAIVEKMTGSLNTELVGFLPSERAYASIALAFAPIYRLATMGLLLDVFKGGYRSREALRIVSSMAAVAMGFSAIGYFGTDNKDAFDPRTPRFMTWRVGDGYIGIGTAYYSLVRIMGKLVEQIQREGPDSIATLGFDNPLIETALRTWRSQSAPIPNITWSLVTGKSYMGDPLRDADDGSWVTRTTIGELSGLALPFWLEGAVSNGLQLKRLPDTLGQIFGYRTFPESAITTRNQLRQFFLEQDNEDERLVSWREERKGKGLEVDWDSAPVLIKTRLEQRHGELDDLEDKIDTQTKLTGTTKQRRIREFMSALDENRRVVGVEMEQVAKRWRDGKLKKGKEFVDEVQGLSAQLRSRHDTVLTNPRYGEVREFLRERSAKLPKLVGENKAYIGDLAFDVYMRDVLLNPNVKGEDGEFLPRQLRKNEEEFKLVWGELHTYVRERLTSGRDIPPEVGDYYKSLELLKGYWDVPNQLWGESSAKTELYEDYLELPQNLRAKFSALHPLIRILQNRVDLRRERMKRDNAEIDLALTKYYDAVPITGAGRKWLRERRSFLQSVES